MRKETSENDLIVAAANDKDVLVTVLSKYVPLVKSCAQYFVGNGMDFEDLLQEGMMGLISAVKSYDNSKSSFPTFAKLCVLRSLCAAVRPNANKSVIPSDMLVDIEDTNIADNSTDPALYVAAREEYSEILKIVKEKLSSFEYSVFCDRLSGFSNKEISDRHSVDRKSVENANLRIHNKLKQIK